MFGFEFITHEWITKTHVKIPFTSRKSGNKCLKIFFEECRTVELTYQYVLNLPHPEIDTW